MTELVGAKVYEELKSASVFQSSNSELIKAIAIDVTKNTEEWNGYVKDGFSIKKAPDGTYFYLIFLNDIDYPEPLKGYLYINQ